MQNVIQSVLHISYGMQKTIQWDIGNDKSKNMKEELEIHSENDNGNNNETTRNIQAWIGNVLNCANKFVYVKCVELYCVTCIQNNVNTQYNA